MANNCCVTPVAPSKLDGTVLENVSILSGVINPAVDIEASATPKGPAGGDLSGTYPNPTVATLTNTTATGMTIKSGTIDENVTINASAYPKGPAGGDLSGTYPDPSVSQSTNQRITTPTLVGRFMYDPDVQETIVEMLENELAKGGDLRDKLIQMLIDALTSDSDAFDALRQCIISGINRCDGTPHAVGDTIPTCDEMDLSLRSLLSTIDDQLGQSTTSTPTPVTTQEELPTTIVGERTQLLGQPTGYLSFGGKLVPYF